jgi:hypothetical protein
MTDQHFVRPTRKEIPMRTPDKSPRTSSSTGPRVLLLDGVATLLAAIVVMALRGPKLPPYSGD